MPRLRAAFLAAVLPLSAGASEIPPHEIYLNAGTFHPTARFGIRGRANDKGETFGKVGPHFAIGYYRNVSRPLAVGLELFRGNRGSYASANPLAAFPGSEAYIKGFSQAALAMFRVRGTAPRWRPYAAAGFGIQQTLMEAFVRAPPNSYWAVNGEGRGDELRYIEGKKTTWAGVARVGVERVFPKGGILGLEAGYFRAPTMSFQRTSDGAVIGAPDTVQANGNAVTVALKFGYSFGLKP